MSIGLKASLNKANFMACTNSHAVQQGEKCGRQELTTFKSIWKSQKVQALARIKAEDRDDCLARVDDALKARVVIKSQVMLEPDLQADVLICVHVTGYIKTGLCEVSSNES